MQPIVSVFVPFLNPWGEPGVKAERTNICTVLWTWGKKKVDLYLVCTGVSSCQYAHLGLYFGVFFCLGFFVGSGFWFFFVNITCIYFKNIFCH